MSRGIELVPANAASLGRTDATRRWALRFPDGQERFPGLTRPEARALASALAGAGRAAWSSALAEVALPAVPAEGAGPHLLDDAGALVIALGPHPGLSGPLIAMGEAQPDHRVGLVARRGPGVWGWLCDARVEPARRVEALDALVALDQLAHGDVWARAFGRSG